VAELFVPQLDDRELAVLENALKKVTVDCTFAKASSEAFT
jgi:hypothetical protein